MTKQSNNMIEYDKYERDKKADEGWNKGIWQRLHQITPRTQYAAYCRFKPLDRLTEHW